MNWEKNQFYYKVKYGSKEWFTTGIGKSKEGVKKRIFKSIIDNVPERDLIGFDIISSNQEDYERNNYDIKSEEEIMEEEIYKQEYQFPIFDDK